MLQFQHISILPMNSDKESYDLGHKIRHYRMRSGMSQFELEVKIGAASGSLSRIEHGMVNPTKETLSKIINTLKLKPSEIAELLGLSLYTTEELILAINSFSASLNLEVMLQAAVDVMFDLFPNYNGGVIFLINQDQNKLYSKTVSNMPFIDLIFKMLPGKFSELEVPLQGNQNLIAKTTNNGEIYESKDILDFSRGYIPNVIANAICKLTKFKYGITMPLLYQNKLIGSVAYTKRVSEAFTNEEKHLLTLLNNQIAIAIKNAEEFTKIKLELQNLKQKYNE